MQNLIDFLDEYGMECWLLGIMAALVVVGVVYTVDTWALLRAMRPAGMP